MGIETTCRVETEAGAGDARVLLETEELIVRGALKARIPLKSVDAAVVDGRKLIVSHGKSRTVLHLGPEAARWADRILNPRSRLEKLGVKPDMVVSCQGVTDPALQDELTAAGATVSWGRIRKDSDLILLGVERDPEVSRIAPAAGSLRPSGAIWVIHPKGKEGVKDTAIFSAGRAAGLVATKVAKFSETHTAEKLVVPVAKRG
ncbi:MAG TPA: hypothetical protein VLB00_09240 [Gemmatimonadales bacterium]|nr:hypothetical protein [Gemmatimonadales bacterium]